MRDELLLDLVSRTPLYKVALDVGMSPETLRRHVLGTLGARMYARTYRPILNAAMREARMQILPVLIRPHNLVRLFSTDECTLDLAAGGIHGAMYLLGHEAHRRFQVTRHGRLTVNVSAGISHSMGHSLDFL